MCSGDSSVSVVVVVVVCCGYSSVSVVVIVVYL